MAIKPTGRVFVASEDAQFRGAMSLALTNQGYQARSCSDCDNAIKSAARFRADLVVVDSLLGPDGRCSIESQLNAAPPNLRCLVVTDENQAHSVSAGRLVREVVVLTRPFNMLQFAEAVDRSVGQSVKNESA